MKKKILAALLATCLMALLLSACGGSSSSGSASAGTSAAGSDAAGSEETYTIKYGVVDSEDQSTYRAAVKFKEKVEADSNGKVVVEIYPNGTLGYDVQLTESVSQGTVEMATVVTSTMVMYDDVWGVWDMPFLFDNTDCFFAALDGEMGQAMAETLSTQNIKGLGYAYNGARSVSNNVRPINEPADLSGIKIRVMESPVYIDLFNTLGANATPMAYGELFTGLQQGTVDGQENAASYVYKAKFFEVQKYYSLTEHSQSAMITIIGQSFFDSLPEDCQIVVANAARECMVDYQRQDQMEDDAYSLEQLKAEGLEINTVSTENIQKFRDRLAPMYEQYEQAMGAEIFEEARSYNQ